MSRRSTSSLASAAEPTNPSVDTRPPLPVRHYGRWIGTAVAALIAAVFARTVITSPGFQWSVVRQYLATPAIISGVERTIELTVISMLIAIALGIVVAVMRMSPNPLVAALSSLYIWFFRGTPQLVQIIFWFNLASLFPRLSLAVPFGPSIYSVNTNSVVTPWVAAILALALNEGAYMAEIVRAGILSVEEGQVDAAHALGMTRLLTMRKIILPQAMKVIIPPTGNETIGMLKTTSLVSVIALPELLGSSQIIYTRTFQTIPLLIVASIWYLVCTTILSIGQARIERYFGRGSSRTPPPSFWQRFRRELRTFHAGASAIRRKATGAAA